jgi:hypothetical protein
VLSRTCLSFQSSRKILSYVRLEKKARLITRTRSRSGLGRAARARGGACRIAHAMQLVIDTSMMFLSLAARPHSITAAAVHLRGSSLSIVRKLVSKKLALQQSLDLSRVRSVYSTFELIALVIGFAVPVQRATLRIPACTRQLCRSPQLQHWACARTS